MPKLIKTKQAPAVKPSAPPPGPDFVLLGHAVALADLASAAGMTVDDVSKLPDRLASAGLPTSPPPSTRHHAHKILRDRCDALLFRMDGRTIDEVRNMPELTPAQVQALVGKQERLQAQQAQTYHKREQKRREDNPTVDGLKAVAADPKAAVTGKPVAAPRPGKTRQTIFGHPATRVVMWMGKNGYDKDRAARILDHYAVSSTPASIATFLRSGVKGDRGEVAPLTAAQADELGAL